MTKKKNAVVARCTTPFGRAPPWPGVFAALNVLRRTRDHAEVRYHKDMLSCRAVHFSSLFQRADDFTVDVKGDAFAHRGETYIVFFLTHPSMGRHRIRAVARQSDSAFAPIPVEASRKKDDILDILDACELRWF